MTAPFGAGCYELRLGDKKVLYGRSKNVAFRMTSLLPRPLGQGTRNNDPKREYVERHLGQIEYRTIACQDPGEAKAVEAELRLQGDYDFGT